MNRKTLGLASALGVAAMLIVSFAVGSGLPSDLRLPVRWSLAGEPTDFASKWVALGLPAAITAATSLLFYFLPSLEPRREGLERSQGLYLWGWAAILLLGASIELAVVATALGWALPVNSLIIVSLGATLVLTGNQLGKSRSMYLIGVRTPWTLASEEVWIKTHRLAGKLMVACGVVLILAAALPIAPSLLGALLFGTIAVAAGVPIVYSYLLWRRERADQPSL
jgi:uncharacterized membrane protein